MCRLRFVSFGIRAQVLKLVFYPFIFCFLLSSYLVPFVFVIPRSYFVKCTRLKSCTLLSKKNKKKKRKEKKEETSEKKLKIEIYIYIYIVCSFNSLRPKYYFLLSSSFDLMFLSYLLVIGISLNTTS